MPSPLIFITISFYGLGAGGWSVVGQVLPGQLIAKIVLSAVLVPPAIYLFVAIGKWLDRKPLVPAEV